MKVLLISNTLAPYRVPVFNAICEQSGHEWVALFETRRLAYAPWEDMSETLAMRHRFLPDRCSRGRKSWSSAAMIRATSRILTEEQADVVVLGGWNSVAVWIAWLKARCAGRPLVLWSGITASSVGHRTRVHNWLRGLIIRTSDAHVAYSTEAARFLQDRGADRRRIFVGPNVGDVDFYLRHVQAHRSQHATSSGTVRLLYVGQLIPRKGIRELLTVLATLRRDDWDLRIIGSGPLRESLEHHASQLGLARQVTFVNYLDRRGLVKEYAEASIFVLPSLLEVGAIVNSEALASGLYSLISKADGVAPDLIDPGVNGERIDVVDTQACAAVINRTLDRAQRGELNPERISQTANRFTPRRYARAFLDAVECALRGQGIACNTPISDSPRPVDCRQP